MTVLSALDAPAVRRWCASGAAALERARAEIDALNVFPVPDGDTGTNLALTMRAVADALEGPDEDLPSTMRAIAAAALAGARGGSGVILSQILRAVAEVLGRRPVAMADDVRRALGHAADAAYRAVGEPVEGTVLTVVREAAQAAAAVDGDDLAAVVGAAARAAADALARTPLQLDVLSASGVVDAGGRGLVVLLDALAVVVAGEAHRTSDSPVVPRAAGQSVVAREAGSPEFGYEVQYLLDAPDDAVPALRTRLAGLGDALVVVGCDGLHKVHVHVNDVGAAVEAAVEVGRPHGITVTRLADQVAAARRSSRSTGRVVAVVPQGGLARVFRDAAVRTVEHAGRVSSAALLDALHDCDADRVVVLPDSVESRTVAESVADLLRAEGRTVAVVPVRSPLQALAAVALHDPGRPFDHDLVTMSAAAASTRHAEICGPEEGMLARVDGEAFGTGADVVAVGARVLDRMLADGGEMVTLVTGSDLPAGATARLLDHLSLAHPEVETVVYAGAPPGHLLLVGVE